MYAKKELSQTAKDILAIADYIEEHGWCQKATKWFDGRVCIVGAGIELGFKLKTYTDAPHPAFRTIKSRVGLDGYNFISWWNDAPGRTKEQVIDMLKDLAYNLDNQEVNSNVS